MKSRTVILSLVLFTLLSTFQYANAQDKDPPPVQVIGPQTEPMLSQSQSNTTLPTINKDNNRAPSSMRSFPRSVIDESDVIDLGDGVGGGNQQNPATAHGGDHYIVAMEEDGYLKIAIARFYPFIYMFSWITPADRASNPDVAYLASTGQFIVVWQHDYYGTGTDYDIKAVAISPDTGGVVGSIQTVAGSSSHERNPSVDCNPNNDSCLVAYENDSGGDTIDGRFMNMTSSGVSGTSPSTFPISISTLGEELMPLVTYGDLGYLVAFTWYNSSNVAWSVYTHVYPDYQSSGNQYMHGTLFLVNPGDLQDDHDKYSSGVAYDACANKFVVLFTYDWSGTGTDLDVGARTVHKNSGVVGDIFWIAATVAHEASGDISFIEDYHLTSSPPYASKLVVAYSRWNSTLPDGIYATDLLSNCSETSTSYRVDPSWNHFLVVEPSPIFGSSVYGPSITGAGGYEQFLVAWTDVTGGTIYDYDVMGRLMDGSEKNFLPLNNK